MNNEFLPNVDMSYSFNVQVYYNITKYDKKFQYLLVPKSIFLLSFCFFLLPTKLCLISSLLKPESAIQGEK